MANIHSSFHDVSAQPKMSVVKAAELLGISVQAIHKQLKAKNINCAKLANKAYLTHSVAKQLFNLQFKKKKVVSQIVKGGTGKTTSLDNIACCVSTYGAKVLLVDLDPQGNLTDAKNVDPDEFPVLIDVISGDANIRDCIISVAEGIDLIPSRIENVVLESKIVYDRLNIQTLFEDIFEEITENYDFVLIDTPPTLGQYVAAADLYADEIVVPLNPDKFSAKGLKILKQEIGHLNKQFKRDLEYKVFLNKFSGNTILSDKAIASIISDPDMEGRALQTAVRFSQEIPNATDVGKNLFSSLKKSTAREDFDQLTRELFQIDLKQNSHKRPEVRAAAMLEG